MQWIFSLIFMDAVVCKKRIEFLDVLEYDNEKKTGRNRDDLQRAYNGNYRYFR